MTQEHSSLPTILAGPILRRLDANQITIWLATSQKLDIRLTFHPESGEIQSYTLDAADKTHVTHLQAAEQLHYHLIDLKLDQDLPADDWISYDFEYRCEGESWTNICTDTPELLYPGMDKLGFIIPKQIKTVLHGSCRKPHHKSGDGLVEADRLLAKNLSGFQSDMEHKSNWPTLLVMTGDQIYADDVAGPMLAAIHSVIGKINAPKEDFSALQLDEIANEERLYEHKNCYYRRAEILPKVKENRALLDILFDGVKKPVFTTVTANNHLITLHENLVMYLMVWSPLPWEGLKIQEPAHLDEKEQTQYREEKAILDDFVKGLPKVRRLFAHMATAMIFDDHDITDDWNLNREWEQEVYGHPFSKRMIGNSLISYLVNQGWGNKPEAFEHDFTHRLSDVLQSPGDAEHDRLISDLLSFQGWEYEWATQPPLIVIDTRTRRWRSESSMVKPAGLLDWEALGDLQQKLYGNKSVLLVSPAPIFGVKLIEIIQKIFTWLGKPLVVDAENWMAHPGTANSILNVFHHSKTPQNFVILSGDVHYSFVYDVEMRRQNKGPDIWQVTSSGLKNEFPKSLLNILDIVNKWLFAPQSPLNWLTKRKSMRIVPRKPEGHADGRRTLNGSGIGLIELDEQGRPIKFQQLIAEQAPIDFHRMESHTRYQ